MKRGIGLLTAAVVAGFMAIAAAPAAAAPQVNGVFDLPGQPKYITVGPDGNIWTTLSGSGGGEDIARITPAGVVTGFDSATYNNPIGITADEDNLWLTQPNEVVKVDPADPANPTDFAVASIADPRGITLGPDGNLWAASNDKVVRIPPANPLGFTDFTVNGMGARGISAGANRIWVADLAGGRVISLTPGGAQTPYDVGDTFGPQEVAADPSTAQVAYGNTAPPQVVGRITPGGVAQPTPAPNTDPFGVTHGTDGAWWFANFATNNLGRLTKNGGYTTLGGLPAASGPRYLTAGPNRTLWVALETSEQVARVTGVDPAPPPPPPPPPTPETNIDKAPKSTVKAGRKGAKVEFEFSSPTAAASFECSLKRRGNRNAREEKLAKYASCGSPKKYRKLRRGRYTFRVRAVVGATKDPTPAEAKFRVKRR